MTMSKTQLNIISPKLKKTLSPFQLVTVIRQEQVEETGVWLVQVRDLRGELIWFGASELEEAVELYERHASIVAGKRARIMELEPQPNWDKLMIRGYNMQKESETLAQADRLKILPFRLNSVTC